MPAGNKDEKALIAEMATSIASQVEDQLTSRLEALLQESLEVEAVCEIIEQLDLEDRISSRFLGLLKREHAFHHELTRVIPAMQKLFRELRLDIELTKRALASLGQTGVMARKQMEKQLTLELFPPEAPNLGAGIQVRYFKAPPKKESITCRERLDLCKAACCKLFNAYLSSHEVRSNGYEWNPERPYALLRRNGRCVYLSSTGHCNLYENRPLSCSTYKCKNDKRIWRDFDKKIINPKLKQWLENESFPEVMDREATEPRDTPEINRNKDEISRYSPDESTSRGKDKAEEEANRDLPVSPPDFSDLKERIAPAPRVVFNPKEDSPEDRGRDDKSLDQ